MPDTSPDLKETLRTLLGSPDAEVTDFGSGRRQILLRGIPQSKATAFSFRMEGVAFDRAGAKGKACEAHGVVDCPECAGERAKKGDGEGKEPAFKSIGSVVGVASSTSKDWYGTEMSLDALKTMAEQFNTAPGVPLLPTHGDWFSVPEWDSVIGCSVEAVIEKAKVVDPHDEKEQGYTLTVTSALLDVPKAVELQGRLDARQLIGQSIGGWFTALSVLYNEETDELERIIVLAVQLDHLAVTRMPANPDSLGLANLRSRVVAALRSIPRPSGLPVSATRAAPNQTGVSRPASATSTLDTSASPGNDGPDPAASRAASEELDMTPEQIAELVARTVTESVTAALSGALPNAVRAAVTDAITPLKADVEALRTRMEALEKAPANRAAPAPAPIADPNGTPKPAATLSTTGAVSDRERALELEVAQLRSAVNVLAERPQRRGVHIDGRMPVITSGPGAADGIRSLATECRAQGRGTALAAVVERHVAVLAEEDGPASVKAGGSVTALRQILRAGLMAAEVDGLISKPGSAEWA